MKRIILIMIFGIVLLLGSVIALTSLSSNIKVEKDGENYYVYTLKEIISGASVIEEKMDLTLEINSLETQLGYENISYDACMKDICGKDYNEKGDHSCPIECEQLQDEYEEQLNYQIEKLNKRLEDLNSLQ